MSEPAIELFQVSKRFGPKVAVNAVTLSVPQGQVYGLIGPNGAGKTTTFSMMCGYLYPSEGNLKVLGVNPTHPGALKGKLGALPQDAILPPGWETGTLLTYWARLSGLPSPEREAHEALDKVGLAEAWTVQTQALSHGMAKRAAMAQALMGQPPLVLLDEPTAGLDPRIAAQVRQVIRDMRGRQTVVVSSHNLQELEELCDGAAILDRGTLAQAGTMSELTSQGAEFRVQIARGEIIPPELTQLPGVTAARMESPGVLLVRFDGQAHRPEEVISRTVAHLLQTGVLILGVSRGRSLEDRVLQIL
ncbi:ABC-type multidrug transport system, ATPase component [Stigmatella aurantiaca]|uniref:ABC-type multidrug transport system, ATPase component n=1 Tax=Stigmatella aurantiaca TaxID=41 RepID=A0A1H8AK76_STIAU|nr:ABC transporter ATP-binding protein [Stigmatella aurantiaca]SEM70394.1 ABC-type multidrug transport system, ATPase component [Stigmatella aurantiaca]